MATVQEKTQGKSGFLKEFFVDHPDAGKAAIDRAWQADGNEDTISVSLISKIRKDLELPRRGRGKVKVSGKKSTSAPNSSARNAGPKAAGRTAASSIGKNVTTVVERPSPSRATGDDRTRVLIRLEGEIDDMLHEVKLAGGLPEFEETLRKARRILVRSHGE